MIIESEVTESDWDIKIFRSYHLHNNKSGSWVVACEFLLYNVHSVLRQISPAGSKLKAATLASLTVDPLGRPHQPCSPCLPRATAFQHFFFFFTIKYIHVNLKRVCLGAQTWAGSSLTQHVAAHIIMQNCKLGWIFLGLAPKQGSGQTQQPWEIE